jgi:hypothetical protein
MNTAYRIVVLPNLTASPAVAFELPLFLFNEPRHLLTQQHNECFTFLMLHHNAVVLRFSGFIEQNTFISPLRATFGGFEFAYTLPDSVLHTFLDYLEKWIKSRGLSGLSFPQAPHSHNPEQAQRFATLLVSRGYSLQHRELNQHLPIDERPFDSHLHRTAKRRLQQCYRAGLKFELLDSQSLPAFHQLLTLARERKGRGVSLSLPALQTLFQTLPSDFLLIGVLAQAQLVAACVVVRLNARALYYFLPADSAEYLAVSPAVMLIEGLYKYAQKSGYELLDLGISSLNGQLNHGLWAFKNRLGAIDTPRDTWQWHDTINLQASP